MPVLRVRKFRFLSYEIKSCIFLLNALHQVTSFLKGITYKKKNTIASDQILLVLGEVSLSLRCVARFPASQNYFGLASLSIL